MGQLLDAFMDDTVTLMDPAKEREYLGRIRNISHLKPCCRSDALKFVSWTPSTVTALCSKCKRHVEYNYRFRHYSYY